MAKRKRMRAASDKPAWIVALIEHGQAPARFAPGHEAYVGWKFFGDEVEGLPSSSTPEGRALADRARSTE